MLTVGMIGCTSTSTNESKLGAKDPKKTVEIRTKIAAEYIRTNQLDRAKQELDAALRINSHSAEANAMMGVLLQQEGSPENLAKAESYFKRALSTDKDNAQIRNNYGTYLFQLKRYTEAAEQFKIAGTTLGYEARYNSLENLGRTYLQLNDVAHAQQAFYQALDVNSGASGAKIGLAGIFFNQKKYDDASKFYEQYVLQVGQANQGLESLWLGIRLAKINNDQLGMKVLGNQLRAQYPESAEYKQYLKLQN